MKAGGLPATCLNSFVEQERRVLKDEKAWLSVLESLAIKDRRHIRIATQGVLIGSLLDHPEIPLHNNLSVSDIREYVKKRKINGSTRS
jgi:hypothetical protein